MHRFAKRLFVLAMVIHIVPSAAVADRLVDGVPIPDDAMVVPPSAAVPESQQRFSGAWVGRWGSTLKHILIVESVQPDGSARVIYGWGDSTGLSITRGYSRFGGNVSGDTLTIESSPTATTYKLTSATSATASRRRGDRHAQADMVKVDLAALIASGEKFAESIMISTKLRESGKPVRLEVVIAKPPGDGPFPLLVANHGSTTGEGGDPVPFHSNLVQSRVRRDVRQEGLHGRLPATARPWQVGRALRRRIQCRPQSSLHPRPEAIPGGR